MYIEKLKATEFMNVNNWFFFWGGGRMESSPAMFLFYSTCHPDRLCVHCSTHSASGASTGCLPTSQVFSDVTGAVPFPLFPCWDVSVQWFPG